MAHPEQGGGRDASQPLARPRLSGARQGASSLALVGLAAALWGTGGPAAKELLLISALDPIEVGFYRLGIAAPVLLLAALLRRRSVLGGLRRHGAWVVGLAVATALYQVCYYVAVDRAGVAIATLITICMAPPIVGLLSSWVVGEPLDRRTRLAMVLTLLGTGLLIGWPASGMRAEGGLFIGAIAALGAAASYAGMVLTSRRLAQDFDPYQLIVLGFGGGALLLFPIVFYQGFATPSSVTVVGLVLFLGLIPTALAYVFFFKGMQQAPAPAASVVSLMEPLVATALGLIIFGERMGFAGSVGAVLMLAGMLALRRK